MDVAEAARETEIGELDLAVGGDEQVVGLDVAVQDEVLVAEPDGADEHAHPGLDVGGSVVHVGGVSDEHLQVAKGKVLEDQVDVLVFGGEDGLEGDDVGVVQLLEVLQFADGVGGHALCVLLLHLNFLDGDELCGVRAEVAQEDYGVSTFTELLACRGVQKLAMKGESALSGCRRHDLPLTYFRFSSSFICSATSRVVGATAFGAGWAAGLGVPLEEVCPEASVLRGDETDRTVCGCCSVTTGERDIFGGKGVGGPGSRGRLADSARKAANNRLPEWLGSIRGGRYLRCRLVGLDVSIDVFGMYLGRLKCTSRHRQMQDVRRVKGGLSCEFWWMGGYSHVLNLQRHIEFRPRDGT